MGRYLSLAFSTLVRTTLISPSAAFAPLFDVMPRRSAEVSLIAPTNKPRTTLAEKSKNGEFIRKDAAWRGTISRKEGAKFPPEDNRYHLYVAHACPWAHRTVLVRALKGLEQTISITVVHPVWQSTKPQDDKHTGWVFGDPSGESFSNNIGLGGPFPAAFPGNEPDPFQGAKSIRELYEFAGDTDGKYSVPLLWDKKTNTIVSNESSEIIRMLNSEFNEFAKNPELDLYPEDDLNQREAIDAVNQWVYPTINNGVYKCGFAKSQEAYNKAIEELTDSFDRIHEILKKQNFIAGNQLTEADIRLFVTLIRFDEVYAVYFKTNTRSVAGAPSMLEYIRTIYRMKGVAETVNMDQIKAHYYASHPDLNRWSVIPRGPDFIKLLEAADN